MDLVMTGILSAGISVLFCRTSIGREEQISHRGKALRLMKEALQREQEDAKA